METNRLLLRRAFKQDVDSLYEARNSNFVLTYNAMDPLTPHEMERMIEADGQNEHAFYLALKKTQQAIGVIYLAKDSLRYDTNTKEISYWIDERYSRLGYMSEALEAIIQYAFFDLKLAGLSARCFQENQASQALLKKLGFKKEGTLKNAVRAYEDIVYDDLLFYLENNNLCYVYILRCQNGNLYTGWTNNLKKRLQQHNTKSGAKYTKAFGPCQLVYYETYTNKQEAMKREYQIKQLTKTQKEQLIHDEK